MVYRFKSRATGDLVMLDQHGKPLLELLGKEPHGPGILLVEQMPAAVEAIQRAIAADEAEQARHQQEAADRGDEPSEAERISLRMRMAPFLEMLRQCQHEGVEMVWGV